MTWSISSTHLSALVLLLCAASCGDSGGDGTPAAGGTAAGDTDGGATAGEADSGGGTTGRAAAGGAPSGGQRTGGSATGGSTTSGGSTSGGASTGGSSGGSSLSVTGVRCFDHNTTNFEYCYGKVGDVWMMVSPQCWPSTIEADDSYTPVSGGPYQNTCTGMSDDLGAWQDVRCWDMDSYDTPLCLFRVGDWWVEAFASCDGVFDGGGLIPAATNDPGTEYCGTPSGTGGWDEIRCYDYSTSALCYGRLGKYWFGPTVAALWLSGLYGSCILDQTTAADWTEIPAAQADCQ
jgi:hypothetical protein